MQVIKLNPVNPPSGWFVGLPAETDIQEGANSYAFCQICRVSNSQGVVTNPTQTLGWNTGGADRIKFATLNSNGWFVDSLFWNINQNYLFYLDSFDPAMQQELCKFLNTNQDGGVLYTGNAATAVSVGEYNSDYANDVVAIGQKPGLYPFLSDTPQQADGITLDFEVYLLACTADNSADDVEVSIGPGFGWTYQAGQTSSFQGLITSPSMDFAQCVRLANQLKNSDNPSAPTWGLAAD